MESKAREGRMWRQTPAETEDFSEQLPFSSESRSGIRADVLVAHRRRPRKPSSRLLFLRHKFYSRRRIRFLIEGKFCLQSVCYLERTSFTFLTGRKKKTREWRKEAVCFPFRLALRDGCRKAKLLAVSLSSADSEEFHQ